MTTSDWLTVLAILLAPFIAIFVQKQIELWRERRDKRLWVFKTLMATRGRTLSLEHVQALNMIELEFTRRSDRAVLAAWRVYLDHLASYPREGGGQTEEVKDWLNRTAELHGSLLGAMGEALGYRFDPVQIRKGAYSPQAHATIEAEQERLRQGILEWLEGKRKVTVSVAPKDEDAALQGQRFLQGMLGLLEGQTRIKVDIGSEQNDERGSAPGQKNLQAP